MSLAWAVGSAAWEGTGSRADVASLAALMAPRSAAVHRARYPVLGWAQKEGRTLVGEGLEREAPSREEACRPEAIRPKRRPAVPRGETTPDASRLGRVNQEWAGPSPPRRREEMTGARMSRPWEAAARQVSGRRTATQARLLSTVTLMATGRAP